MNSLGPVAFGSLSLFALLAAACASDDASTPVAARPATSNVARACGLSLLAPVADVGEGSRVFLDGADLAEGATVEISRDGEPMDFVRADKRLMLRAPYGGAQSFELAVRATCAAGTSEASVKVSTRAMKWTSIAKWTWKVGVTDLPPGREYSAMWLDPRDDDRLLVFGGFHYHPKQFTSANDFWEFSFATSTWRPVAANDAPARPGGRVAAIPGEPDVIFYGGSVRATTTDPLQTPSETYRIGVDGEAASIVKVETAGDALGSYTGSLVYDAPRKRLVSACGVSSDVGANCEAFALSLEGKTSGRRQQLDVTGEVPKGRMGFHYAYDAEGERLVIFGGDRASSSKAEIEEETWALELGRSPAQWARVLPAQNPPIGRRNGAWVYDSVENRLLVWGGTANGASSMPGLDILHLDRNKEAWHHVDVPAEVPARTSGAAVFDAKKRRMVAGFGNGKKVETELWALDL